MLSVLVIGITSGAVYALLALAVALVNKASRVLNAAQGEIGALSAFVLVVVWGRHGLTLWVSLPISVGIGAAVSLAIWALVKGGARPRGPLPPFVGTIAALTAFSVVELRWLGGSGQLVRNPFHGLGWKVAAGTYVSPTQMLVLGVVAATCVGLWAGISRTALGLELRASADNLSSARLIGLRPKRVEATAWVVAGALSGLGGVLYSWIRFEATPGFGTLLMPAVFAAAIIGGLSSLPGAVVGGMIVGVAQALARNWFNTSGVEDLVVFALLAVLLLIRPEGLLGGGRSMAFEASESLVALHPLIRPPVRPDRLVWDRWAVRSAALLAVTGLLMTAAPITDYKLALLPIYAILALSLNFLLTTTGQVSLCQVGLLGLGAMVTGVAQHSWGMPAPMALAAGALVGAGASLLIGAVALRVRGLYLGVLTLAFGVFLDSYLFPRPFFSNGGAGITVTRPRLGPLDFSSDRNWLLLMMLAVGVVWALDAKILSSPAGRALIGLRDNQTAASARAIPRRALPVAAFTYSGGLAGLAGGMLAFHNGIVSPSAFPALSSLTFVLYVVIGGIGSRVGVVAVSAGFVALNTFNVPVFHGDTAILLASALLLLTVGRHPEGLGGWARQRWAARRAEKDATVVQRPEGPAPATLAAPAPAPPVRTGRPVLEADSLSVDFSGLRALDRVSIKVHPGEIVAVIGPNGAGKTTLFNCLSGFVKAASGLISLEGLDISSMEPAARAALGLGRTFQQGGLCLSETALGNLLIAQHHSTTAGSPTSLLALGPGEGRSEQRRLRLAGEVLDILRLGPHAGTAVADLPYGMRKSLELGCALLSRPRVLLVDEPAAGASQADTVLLAEVIGSIRRDLGIAVLLIDHHVPFVRDLADHAYALNFGSLITGGTVDEVTAHPQVREAYLGHKAFVEMPRVQKAAVRS